MSLKIAKKKGERNLLRCVIICSALVQVLAKWLALTSLAADAQEAAGKSHEPWPYSKAWDTPETETLKLNGILTPVRKQPQLGRYHLRRLYCSSRLHPELAFLILSAKDHFHIYHPTSPQRQFIKPKERWSIRNRSLAQVHQACERWTGEQRNSCSPKPVSIPHGDRAQQACLDGRPVQPLRPAAQTCCSISSWDIQWIWPCCFYRED